MTPAGPGSTLQRNSVARTGLSRWWVSSWRWWGPVVAYMGLIFWMSSRPAPALARHAPDEILHFLAYLLMALLAVRAFHRGLRSPVAWRPALCGVALSLAYAASDEWHQRFVPGRVASLGDLGADAAGALAAWVGLYAYGCVTGRTGRVNPAREPPP